MTTRIPRASGWALCGLLTWLAGVLPAQESPPPVALEGLRDAYAVAWLDDARLAAGGADGSVTLYDLAARRVERTLGSHADQVLTLAAHGPGQLLASAGKDRVVKLWNLAAADQPPKDAASLGKGVYCVAFSADGKRLAACGEDDTRIYLWDVEQAKQLKQLTAEDPVDKNQRRSLHGVALTADGRRLASCGADRTVRVWDVDEGRELRRLEAADYFVFTEKDKKIERTTHRGASDLPLFSVAISDDGKWVAASGVDKTIRVWDADSGELKRTLPGLPDFVYFLRVKPSGRLVSGGHAGHLRVWDATSPQPAFTLRLPEFVRNYALSPSGEHVAAAGAQGNAFVVSLPAGAR